MNKRNNRAKTDLCSEKRIRFSLANSLEEHIELSNLLKNGTPRGPDNGFLHVIPRNFRFHGREISWRRRPGPTRSQNPPFHFFLHFFRALLRSPRERRALPAGRTSRVASFYFRH